MKVSNTQEQRDIAKRDKKGLLVFGVDYRGGKFSLYGPEDHEMCGLLLLFMTGVHVGLITEDDVRPLANKVNDQGLASRTKRD